MTTKRLLKRTMALTMVLMLLLMTLISCGGGGASSGLSMQNDVVRFPEYELEQELNEDGTPKVDAEGNPVYKVKLDANGAPIQKTDAEGKLVWKNKLDQEELTQLAKMLVGAYSKDYNTLILLVSAANGYAVMDVNGLPEKFANFSTAARNKRRYPNDA